MMIHSLLDTDLYKFTMQQVVFHFFRNAEAEYRLFCRTKGIDLRPYKDEIIDEIKQFCTLKFKQEELDYLASLPYLKPDYLKAIQNYKPNFDYVHISDNDELELIISGPWFETIIFEVPFLAIISEVYSRDQVKQDVALSEARRRLQEKIQWIKESHVGDAFRLSDFGTRRRFSYEWQDELIRTLKTELGHRFVGTSNVLLAQKYQTMLIGTMAHEYLQACQVLAPTLRESQHFAFETWLKEYGHRLSIALSDVYNLDSFLRDFDKKLATDYQGARHDSGDPFEWGERVIEHYKKLSIDSREKILVFSDGLTIPKALRICEQFHTRAKPTFGIGTHLTNDVGFEAIQIVIKMTGCNGKPVAKLTDSPDKQVCTDQAYLQKLKKIFGAEEKY
jgi:nicotinate phosphoribosyltransferase